MFRSGSIKVANIFGIRIGVDASWFAVLFLFVFILSDSFQQLLDGPDSEAYIAAAASALLFFVSLILHELGHALQARREGIEITGIDLWFFGGVAKMAREAETPAAEFKVAAAGPAVTLLVVAVCTGIGIAISGSWQTFWDTLTLNSDVHVTAGTLLVTWLAEINAFVLAFNLLPAFPLDGGRMIRALAWRISGNRNKATRISAQLGQLLASLMIAGGVILIFNGYIASGLWPAAIGFFLLQAARGTLVQTKFSEQIEGITVADIMDAQPIAVPSELEIGRAVDEFFMRYHWPWFPVVDSSGRFIGLIDEKQADEKTVQDPQSKVVETALPADQSWQIRSDAPIEAAFGSRRLREFGSLIAVDEYGILRGIVTMDQLRRAIESALPSAQNTK